MRVLAKDLFTQLDLENVARQPLAIEELICEEMERHLCTRLERISVEAAVQGEALGGRDSEATFLAPVYFAILELQLLRQLLQGVLKIPAGLEASKKRSRRSR